MNYFRAWFIVLNKSLSNTRYLYSLHCKKDAINMFRIFNFYLENAIDLKKDALYDY